MRIFRVAPIVLDHLNGGNLLLNCGHSGLNFAGGPLALYVQRQLGATLNSSLPQVTHALVDRLSEQVLSHHVRGIICTEHFTVLELLAILSLLIPQRTDIDVAELACALPLSYRQAADVSA